MTEPTRREAIQALRSRSAAVLALTSYGEARPAQTPADVDAALADPESSLMVVSGDLSEYAHLLHEQHRHVAEREQPGPESPTREPDGEADPWPPQDDDREGGD